jgi:hypothetical protein
LGPRVPLLDRLRPMGTPCLGLRVESAIAALPVARLDGAGERILSEKLTAAGTADERSAEPERLSGAGIRLSDSGERLPGAESARIALQALHGQLLSQLMERDTKLLGHCIVNGELLHELAERRDEMLCRMMHTRMAGGRVRLCAKRILLRILLGAKRILLAQSCLPGILTEWHIAATHAGLAK